MNTLSSIKCVPVDQGQIVDKKSLSLQNLLNQSSQRFLALSYQLIYVYVRLFFVHPLFTGWDEFLCV